LRGKSPTWTPFSSATNVKRWRSNNNLIKQYRPKFNVVLRDDKTYPYIKFTAAEKYPRVYFTRRIKKDGSLYFGPYFPSSLARRILPFCAQAILGAILHGGPLAISPAAVPAVLHQTVPGPLRYRADDATNRYGRKPRATYGLFLEAGGTI